MLAQTFRRSTRTLFVVLLGSWLTICQALALPSGWESYDSRPDILDVAAKNHELGQTWQQIKNAQFAFVAELLEFYPQDTHIYFLARDMEYAYDTAKLVTAGTADAERIHLLNISSKNVKDAHLKEYLAQNGVDEKNLASGRKILFVDSAFAGSIPEQIKNLFAPPLRENIKTQMVVSANPMNPSSRAFLVHLNPDVNHRSPPSMNGTIASYEHMPRYTDRSTQFVFEDGQYRPISQIGGRSEDGSVSKEIALRQMQDLKADWQMGQGQKSYAQKKAAIRWLKMAMTSEDASFAAQVKTHIEKLSFEGKNFYEAVIRDVFAMRANANLKVLLKIQDYGLKPVDDYAPAELAKSQDVAHAHPEWAKILAEPHSGIKALFMVQDWATISKLVDADISAEVNEILAKRLFDGPATGTKKSLQVALIEKKDQAVLEYLAAEIFSRPMARDMKDLIQLTAKFGGSTTQGFLERYVYSPPHGKDLQAKTCQSLF